MRRNLQKRSFYINHNNGTLKTTMPLYKRKRGGASGRPASKKYKSGAMVPRVPRLLGKSAEEKWSQMEYKFKRTFTHPVGEVISATTGFYTLDLTVKMDDLPGVSDFTGLFDQYKITGAKWTIMPLKNVSGDTVTAGPSLDKQLNLAQLITVIDKDDDTALGSLSAAQQYSSFKIDYLDGMKELFFVPRPTLSAPGTAIYATPNTPQWIDMAGSSLKHFCGKAAVMCSNAGTDTAYTFRAWCTLYFTCKATL